MMVQISFDCWAFYFLIYFVYVKEYCDAEENGCWDFDGVTHLSTPEFENIVYMRKYCNGEQIGFEILTELHVFTTPEYNDI
jgi:hypothetical protein